MITEQAQIREHLLTVQGWVLRFSEKTEPRPGNLGRDKTFSFPDKNAFGILHSNGKRNDALAADVALESLAAQLEPYHREGILEPESAIGMLRTANARVLDRNEGKFDETNASAIIAFVHPLSSDKKRLTVAGIGDCRLYVFRHGFFGGKLEQITIDDTPVHGADDRQTREYQNFVSNAFDTTQLNREQKRLFDLRTQVTQALGQREIAPRPPYIVEIGLKDRVLLVSPGVHLNLTTERIRETLSQNRGDQEAADALVSKANVTRSNQSNPRHIMDDLTAVVVGFETKRERERVTPVMVPTPAVVAPPEEPAPAQAEDEPGPDEIVLPYVAPEPTGEKPEEILQRMREEAAVTPGAVLEINGERIEGPAVASAGEQPPTPEPPPAAPTPVPPSALEETPLAMIFKDLKASIGRLLRRERRPLTPVDEIERRQQTRADREAEERRERAHRDAERAALEREQREREEREERERQPQIPVRRERGGRFTALKYLGGGVGFLGLGIAAIAYGSEENTILQNGIENNYGRFFPDYGAALQVKDIPSDMDILFLQRDLVAVDFDKAFKDPIGFMLWGGIPEDVLIKLAQDQKRIAFANTNGFGGMIGILPDWTVAGLETGVATVVTLGLHAKRRDFLKWLAGASTVWTASRFIGDVPVRAVQRVGGRINALHPENPNLYFTDAKMAHAMNTAAFYFGQEKGKKPKVLIRVGSEHNNLEEFLKEGLTGPRRALTTFIDGFYTKETLQEAVNRAGGVDNFCSVLSITLPSDFDPRWQTQSPTVKEEFRKRFKIDKYTDNNLRGELQRMGIS